MLFRSERVNYKGPLLSRHEALRSILRNVKRGVFRKEIAEALVTVTGIYPPGNILKIISTNEFCISGGKFRDFSSEAPVFVLKEDISVKESRIVKAENLVDVPDAAGMVLPPETWVQILSYYLDDRESA